MHFPQKKVRDVQSQTGALNAGRIAAPLELFLQKRKVFGADAASAVLNGNREAAVGEVCAYVYLCAGVFIGVGKEVVENLLQAEPIPVQQAVRDGGNGSAAQIV